MSDYGAMGPQPNEGRLQQHEQFQEEARDEARKERLIHEYEDPHPGWFRRMLRTLTHSETGRPMNPEPDKDSSGENA
jgi:hypothetical protein